MIQIQCPQCHTKLAVKEAMAGRLGACPKCQTRVRIPELETITPDDVPEERISTAPKREAGAQRARPPRRADDDDDDNDEDVRPARSRRRRIEDADDRADDEEPAPRRRPKKKKRKRRSEESSLFTSIDPFYIGLACVGIIWLITFVLSIFVPVIAFVPIGLGYLLSFVGGIWLLVVAFQTDVTAGLLCLFVPCYSLFFVFSNFDECKKPFFAQVLGTVMIMSGFVAATIGGAMHHEPPPNFRGALSVPARVHV
jgi:hypothetical protein